MTMACYSFSKNIFLGPIILGFGNVWIYQNVADDKYSLNELTLKLRYIFCQEWQASINVNSRYENYSCNKMYLNPKHYLLKNNSLKNRRCLAQMRTGGAGLQPDIDRWQNGRNEDRICTLCNVNLIEDKFHVTLKYPLYNEKKKDDCKVYINSFRV